MKNRIYLFAAMFSLSTMMMAAPAMAKSGATKEQQEVRATEIKERLNEIKAMDFSTLNKAEKVSLRHEVRSMNKEMSTMDPVVIVVSGCTLIIILLLVLLLV